MTARNTNFGVCVRTCKRTNNNNYMAADVILYNNLSFIDVYFVTDHWCFRHFEQKLFLWHFEEMLSIMKVPIVQMCTYLLLFLYLLIITLLLKWAIKKAHYALPIFLFCDINVFGLVLTSAQEFYCPHRGNFSPAFDPSLSQMLGQPAPVYSPPHLELGFVRSGLASHCLASLYLVYCACFRLMGPTTAPRENPSLHMENMQTPHIKAYTVRESNPGLFAAGWEC